MQLPFQVIFQYDEPSKLWEVIVKGAMSELEAKQGFNAVVLTAGEVTPKCEYNRAILLEDGSYKISVGIHQSEVNN